ncbi:MAG: MFS transporter [Acidobacteriota bacterium]|nr:MFS transporter [Acidobacteriota bacterium]
MNIDVKDQHESQVYAQRLDAYSSFRHRDYRFLLAGAFLTNFGLQALSVAVSWDLYLQTHSALVLGNVGFVQVAPFLLLSIFAGHVADTYDRRALMVLTQAVYVAASLVLTVGFHSVFAIYSVLLMTSIARTFQAPARGAMLPQIVPLEDLGNAITWNSSAQEIANVSGPALAGLLLALSGSRTVYLLQTLFAILTLLCFGLISSRTKRTGGAGARDLKSLLGGIRFVWQNKLILSAVSLDMFGVLFGGATALLPIFAVDILHGGASALGWLRAAPSVGAVLMAVTLAHSKAIEKAGRALLLTVAGFGAATIGFGLSRNLWLSLALLVLVGAFDNISVVLRHSLVQTKTPDHVRGRVLAVNNIFISCSNQLGAVESGWTAAFLGASTSVWAGGVATIVVVAVCAAVSPAIRHWRQ